MKPASIDYKNIENPPGGILIWILISLELITFGVALIVLAVYSREDPMTYHLSSKMLNTTYGAINTVFLLASGFFMATSLHYFKNGENHKSSQFVLLSILGGMLFLGLKTVEYIEKIDHGLTMGHDTFFNFYWLLTGFHVIHVLVGLVILTFIYFGLKKSNNDMLLEDIEAGTSFWHMCDLIWLLLFPTLYLIF